MTLLSFIGLSQKLFLNHIFIHYGDELYLFCHLGSGKRLIPVSLKGRGHPLHLLLRITISEEENVRMTSALPSMEVAGLNIAVALICA